MHPFALRSHLVEDMQTVAPRSHIVVAKQSGAPRRHMVVVIQLVTPRRHLVVATQPVAPATQHRSCLQQRINNTHARSMEPASLVLTARIQPRS